MESGRIEAPQAALEYFRTERLGMLESVAPACGPPRLCIWRWPTATVSPW